MATARIKDEGECYYHLASRTAYQDYKFGDGAIAWSVFCYRDGIRLFANLQKRVADAADNGFEM